MPPILPALLLLLDSGPRPEPPAFAVPPNGRTNSREAPERGPEVDGGRQRQREDAR